MATMLSYRDMAAEVMHHLVTHAAHGYSQPARKGDGTTETFPLTDGTSVSVHGGDYDCSEAVRMCYAAVGVLPADSYMWTGNEQALLLSHGFERVPLAEAGVGDVLWRSGHTEMVIRVGGRLKQAGFRLSERGTTSGAKGDQTGRESAYSDLSRASWAACYRCTKARPSQRAAWVGGGDRWWYRHADGGWTADGWERVDGEWYRFDSRGWMQYGWVEDGGKWYRLHDSHDGRFGAMDVGWQNVGGKWYLLRSDGSMATGWQQVDGKWYYMDANGQMVAADLRKVSGKWYAFADTGEMVVGEVSTDQSGALQV